MSGPIIKMRVGQGMSEPSIKNEAAHREARECVDEVLEACPDLDMPAPEWLLELVLMVLEYEYYRVWVRGRSECKDICCGKGDCADCQP